MKKLFLPLLTAWLIMSLAACSGAEKSGKLFSTECDIEDYCENTIIVSKSDGKVAGVLDNKGKEVLPLKYDEVEFLNKDRFVQGVDKKLYLKLKYEGETSLVDTDKKEIFKTSGYIYYIKQELNDEKSDKTPFFYESVNGKYNVYNENGEKIHTLSAPKNDEEILWVNNKYYCIKNKFKNGNGIATYDYNGRKIDEINGFMSRYYALDNSIRGFMLDKITSALYNPFSEEDGNVKVIDMDANGKISVIKTVKTANELTKEEEKLKSMRSNSEQSFELYMSNGTWKLEDLNGKSLYEERYFERLSPNGIHNCVALTNEDNSVCIIGHQGAKYIDFGKLRYDPKSENVFMSISKDEEKKIDSIFEGKNSIIIPVKGENGNDIYLFAAE